MEATVYCDFCGRIIPEGQLKYVVSIEVFAPYEILEINEEDLLKEDFESEIRACLKQMRTMDPEDLEPDVYKSFHFTVCRPCQQDYIRDPLHYRPPDVH